MYKSHAPSNHAHSVNRHIRWDGNGNPVIESEGLGVDIRNKRGRSPESGRAGWTTGEDRHEGYYDELDRKRPRINANRDQPELYVYPPKRMNVER